MADQAVAKKTTVDRRTVRPAGTIIEHDDFVTLRLEMPGVSKKNVEITMDGESLIVHGGRDAYADDVRFVLRERRDVDFRASYTLDERIDREKIEAEMAQGVLTVTLQLKEEVKPRSIAIN